jgi:hypothetical protein
MGVDVGKNVGEKSVEVGKEVGEQGLELGKKGIGKIKKFVTNKEDPLQILKIRYVQGEITKKQYEEMKKTLE